MLINQHHEAAFTKTFLFVDEIPQRGHSELGSKHANLLTIQIDHWRSEGDHYSPRREKEIDICHHNFTVQRSLKPFVAAHVAHRAIAGSHNHSVGIDEV